MSWTSNTWQVEDDNTDGLFRGDQLSFFSEEGNGIQVQNRSFVWGTDCDYKDDFTATVKYGTDTYKLVRSGNMLTCSLDIEPPAPAPAPVNFPLLGLDDLPGRGARRRVRAKSRSKSRSKRESECEFPTLGESSTGSWTAIEGGGGQP